jgi:hypothetical protein
MDSLDWRPDVSTVGQVDPQPVHPEKVRLEPEPVDFMPAYGASLDQPPDAHPNVADDQRGAV